MLSLGIKPHDLGLATCANALLFDLLECFNTCLNLQCSVKHLFDFTVERLGALFPQLRLKEELREEFILTLSVCQCVCVQRYLRHTASLYSGSIGSRKLVVLFLICGSRIASKASNCPTDILK